MREMVNFKRGILYLSTVTRGRNISRTLTYYNTKIQFYHQFDKNETEQINWESRSGQFCNIL